MQLVTQQMIAGANSVQLTERVNEYLKDGKWVVVPGTVECGPHGSVAVLQETPDMEMMQKMAQMRQQMSAAPQMRGGGAPPAAPGGLGQGAQK
jgi:hypothetical protein